jgi:hypothetical protein
LLLLLLVLLLVKLLLVELLLRAPSPVCEALSY